MAEYLGFRPVDPDSAEKYYFISYCSADAERVRPYAECLYNKGVPLWYDFGLNEIGGSDGWGRISLSLSRCSRVIMFISRNALSEENNGVYQEFKMAEICGKDIDVVMLDDIVPQTDVPRRRLAWWAKLIDYQWVIPGDRPVGVVANEIAGRIGCDVREAVADRIVNEFRELYDQKRFSEANSLLRRSMEETAERATAYTLARAYGTFWRRIRAEAPESPDITEQASDTLNGYSVRAEIKRWAPPEEDCRPAFELTIYLDGSLVYRARLIAPRNMVMFISEWERTCYVIYEDLEEIYIPVDEDEEEIADREVETAVAVSVTDFDGKLSCKVKAYDFFL